MKKKVPAKKRVVCGLDSSGSREGLVVGLMSAVMNILVPPLTGTSCLGSDYPKVVLCRDRSVNMFNDVQTVHT